MALGIDIDRIATDEPAHHVHHMRKEEPFRTRLAAPAQHLGRHIDCVAESRIGHDGSAEIAALDIGLGPHIERMPAGVKIDHELDARLFRGPHHGDSIGHRRRKRLLDHHVLACFEHGDRRLAMEMIRGGNRHRFDIAQGNVIELGGPSRGELLSKRPGARFVAIANQLDLPARVGCKRERVIPAPTGTREYGNVQERETRYHMIEEFSLFKKEGDLTLPHIIKIKLSVDSQNGTFLAEWVIKLTQFEFNQKIDPSAFNLSAN